MSNVLLNVFEINKQYESKPLLEDVSFQLHEDETLCLLGPSGSGKSTMLRLIAGLENVESGDIQWKGESVLDVPVHQRNFGLMFQAYALFPHLTVAENIAFGPKIRDWSQEMIAARIKETLELVKLEGFKERRVVDLSGGEKQRVALARTIATRPKLLMLDEPLGALDKKLRDELGGELREILKELHIPTIYVTHDQEEAFAVGDTIAVLNFGSILQIGRPEDIFRNPGSRWIAGFLGFTNQVQVNSIQPKEKLMITDIGKFQISDPSIQVSEFKNGWLVLKPTYIQPAENGNRLKAQVLDSQFRGEYYQLTLLMENGSRFWFRDEVERKKGETIEFSIPSSAILLYRDEESTD